MSKKTKDTKKETQQQQPKEQPTISERFIEKVGKEFSVALGQGLEFSDYHKKLASNMYLMIDGALKEFEAKRIRDNKTRVTPYTWENINLTKLAIDAVHRVRLGLDALIPNHLHAIPYWNSKLEKYDIDLRIGYRGKDYYRRKFSQKKVKNIRYELKFDSDEFEAIKKDIDHHVETYRFKITNPFDRGEVEGGFGYIMYEDESENELVMVPESEFQKIQDEAKASNFWADWGDRMRYKTLVHRVTDHLQPDPEKIHMSYHIVEQQDNIFAGDAEVEGTKPRQKMDFNDTEIKSPVAGLPPADEYGRKREAEELEKSLKQVEKEDGVKAGPATVDDPDDFPDAFNYKTAGDED